MHTMGVVLAGGKSSRMGKDKSLLDLGGRPVIEHVVNQLKNCSDEVCVITNNPGAHQFLDVPLYSDRYTEKGPLAGIESAMYHNNADIYMFAACDMPFIESIVYNYLLEELEGDAVIPVYKEKLHPLAGIYTSDVLPTVQQLLDCDIRKVRRVFDHVHVKYVENFREIQEEALFRHFFNMNYPEQYMEAKSY